MFRKAKPAVILLTAILTASLLLPSCSSEEEPEITAAEIKASYETDAVTEKNMFAPMWNVEKDARFILHFNSRVEPALAASVHTDPSCNADSAVGQINCAYIDPDDDTGVDVIVCPGVPVLEENEGKASWGSAPIYYLRINYDRFSTEVTKLDTPAVIPFTVKAPVSTPYPEGSTDDKGNYRLRWRPVKGAVKYEIYSTETASDGKTRSQSGYCGDALKKIGTTEKEEFSAFAGKEKTIKKDKQGNVTEQNAFRPLAYYVRAVDADGSRSNYSPAVESSAYTSKMPVRAEFSTRELIRLPDTIDVRMKDRTVASMPANFTRQKDDKAGNAVYSYEIPGTMLTGTVTVKGGQLPKFRTSNATPSYGAFRLEHSISIPDKDAVVSDSETLKILNGTYLSGKELTLYPKALRNAAAELEKGRASNGGVYPGRKPKTLISDYGSIYDRGEKTEPVKAEPRNDKTSRKKEEAEPEKDGKNDEKKEEADRWSDEYDNVTTTGREEGEGSPDPQADEEGIPDVGYRLFADSPEEDYLARMLIAGREQISVSDFPKLKDPTFLDDAFTKTVYQNPYILSVSGYTYDPQEETVTVRYAQRLSEIKKRQEAIRKGADSILSSALEKNMSPEDIAYVLWNELEDGTEFDYEACRKGETSGWNIIDRKNADSFSAYGILCRKKGVGQSYAYAYRLLLSEAGIDTAVLTGRLDRTMPHCWVAAKIKDSWYWFDPANNAKNTGIPYMLYETSSEEAQTQDYVTDSLWKMDTHAPALKAEDNTRSYYYHNELVASSLDDVPETAVRARENVRYGSWAVLVKGGISTEQLDEDAMRSIAKAFLASGMTEDELGRLRIGTAHNYLFFMGEAGE